MRTLPAGKRLQQWRRFLEFGLSEYAGALKSGNMSSHLFSATGAISL
jgi:hypothetical protein